uniref:C-type lectin domain-containing protein n=1 Tax=Caenorhabditis tropicalis TaxID=1561998 RepID=A0A1I7TF32_9PELO
MKTVLLLCGIIGIAYARFSSSESCEGKLIWITRGCPAGWTRFNRGTYGWCIRVFTGSYSQTDCENRCKTQGATLSGIQNQNEAIAIGRATMALISQPSGTVRIGLYRTVACSTAPLSTRCNSMNSFWWTDRTTTGTDGLLWNNNQPDNARAQTQRCAVLLASNTATVVDQWTWQANRLDDIGCNYAPPGDHPRGVRAFVCGKKATV